MSGYLFILAKAGDKVPVGTTVGFIMETKEEMDSLERQAEPARNAATHIVGGSSELYQGVRVRSTSPLVGIRKAIAEHMQRSLLTSAQVTVMGEIDGTEIVELRNRLLAQEQALGTRITYSDLLISTVAKALRLHPTINASIINGKILVWDEINVAFAVSVEDGVITPVIRNADEKSLVEISQEVKMSAQRARDRTLRLDEVRGGTFTVSNLGAVGAGWRFDTIIINQPQSAILATGGIVDRPAVRDGKIVVRPIMTYMLTYDHRLLEGGGIITRFINSLTELLEHPDPKWYA